jgi:sugar/nucleoside kinase (ribokinase family)
VSVEYVVVTPAYLDYTLVGLEALPAPGEETFAGDLLRSPGGGASSAVAAKRLGMSVALASPLGDDLAGRYVRRALEDEGIEVGEPRGSRTPVTVVLPVDGERAMVTVDPGLRARRADVEAHSPRAVSATLEQIDLVPAGPHAYVTCGDDDARAFAGRIPRADFRTCALFANRRDAGILTGASAPEECARRLSEVAETAVVTLGDEGAVAAVGDRIVRIEGVDTGPAVDSTGAGDLFATAFAWADLLGADAELALLWANLYAGMSVTVLTGAAGALTREALLAEGARRGFPELPAATIA